jgi:hypothetical protein
MVPSAECGCCRRDIVVGPPSLLWVWGGGGKRPSSTSDATAALYGMQSDAHSVYVGWYP